MRLKMLQKGWLFLLDTCMTCHNWCMSSVLMLNVQFLFNYLNGIRIFLQIRIRIRIFSCKSRIFGFGFENFLTTNKIRDSDSFQKKIRYNVKSKKCSGHCIRKASPAASPSNVLRCSWGYGLSWPWYCLVSLPRGIKMRLGEFRDDLSLSCPGLIHWS